MLWLTGDLFFFLTDRKLIPNDIPSDKEMCKFWFLGSLWAGSTLWSINYSQPWLFDGPHKNIWNEQISMSKSENIAVGTQKTKKKKLSTQGLEMKNQPLFPRIHQLFFRWWEEIKDMWKYRDMKCRIPPVSSLCGCSELQKAKGKAKSFWENQNLGLKWPKVVKAVPILQGHQVLVAFTVRL